MLPGACASIATRVGNLKNALRQTLPGYSATDTARMLNRISDATGGRTCAAQDEAAQMQCADNIAADLATRKQ